MDTIMSFIKVEMVSSMFRENKFYIFANRISAFNYWQIVDHRLDGVLSFPEFAKFLSVFGIKGIATENGFCDLSDCNSNSSINIYNKEDSLARIHSNSIPSFRIFEYLFLEKCLIV